MNNRDKARILWSEVNFSDPIDSIEKSIDELLKDQRLMCNNLVRCRLNDLDIAGACLDAVEEDSRDDKNFLAQTGDYRRKDRRTRKYKFRAKK